MTAQIIVPHPLQATQYCPRLIDVHLLLILQVSLPQLRRERQDESDSARSMMNPVPNFRLLIKSMSIPHPVF